VNSGIGRSGKVLRRTLRLPDNTSVVTDEVVAAGRAIDPRALITAICDERLHFLQSLKILSEARGFGLFNALSVPPWLSVVASVVVLDLAIYLQHVLFHAVPGLWRLHRMHHSDLEFDVSTGLRFHPIEILLSMLIKLAVIAAIGAPPLAVLIFEVLLNATSIFNHANIRVPGKVDRVLRWFVVTHRVHHSILVRETNSNFGFNLPWWDRLFGTYRAQPTAGHETMTIGVKQFRDPRDLRMDRMLLQPFLGDVGRYPIGQRDADQ
jgi:sterol desaturase/sphingolipid hydroxylase (fatty acid hydroxylase superfamily)